MLFLKLLIIYSQLYLDVYQNIKIIWIILSFSGKLTHKIYSFIMLLIISCWTPFCLNLAALSKKGKCYRSIDIGSFIIPMTYCYSWITTPAKWLFFYYSQQGNKMKTLFYRIMWRIDFYLIQWYFTITFCFFKIKGLSSFTFFTMVNIKYRMMICFLKHLFLRVFVIYFK